MIVYLNNSLEVVKATQTENYQDNSMDLLIHIPASVFNDSKIFNIVFRTPNNRICGPFVFDSIEIKDGYHIHKIHIDQRYAITASRGPVEATLAYRLNDNLIKTCNFLFMITEALSFKQNIIITGDNASDVVYDMMQVLNLVKGESNANTIKFNAIQSELISSIYHMGEFKDFKEANLEAFKCLKRTATADKYIFIANINDGDSHHSTIYLRYENNKDEFYANESGYIQKLRYPGFKDIETSEMDANDIVYDDLFVDFDTFANFKEKVIPKRLSVLSNLPSNADKSKCMLYVDNNGTPSKISLESVKGTRIILGSEKPSDMLAGDFFIKEIE